MGNLSIVSRATILFLIFLCSGAAAVEKIDINTVSFEELQKIKWVGPVTAQRIIDARPFYSLDDLVKVSGLGEKRLADIKAQSLAWVDPGLKPPKAENKTAPPQKTLAVVSQPVKQVPTPFFVFLTALALAFFCGGTALALKKKIKIEYNKNI